MTLQIVPLSDAIGAQVSGIDWTQPVDENTVMVINTAFLSYHLLCLRTEPLTPQAFAQVSRCFGEPQLQLLRKYRNEEAPEVSILESTYKKPENKKADLLLDRRSGWHTDDSYFAVPAKATLLQALEMPEYGGETRFCNVRAAYEDLSKEMKARLDGLRAVHSYDTLRAQARAATRTKEEEVETPDVLHPLIRTHDDTGEKAIYFNSNRTDRIMDMDRAESDAVLDQVHNHMTQTKYQYQHSWRIGDVLLWDNRSVTHSVNMDFPPGQRRVHQRILLKGSVPV